MFNLNIFLSLYRLWADSNPEWIEPRNNQASPKVMVWLGIFSGRIIGPFFYRTTVNSERYHYMLSEMVLPICQQIGMPDYFLHDGAPPHASNIVRQWLDETFPNKWIGRYGPIPWAPRSPDLNPLDYYLWGYVKHEVYKRKIESLDHLMVRNFLIFF